MAKTPTVREDTNQETRLLPLRVNSTSSGRTFTGAHNRHFSTFPTRQAAVQLNIVEDDVNVTSEPCCAPTNQPFCTSKIWVFHDIETTIRARKCRNPLRIFKWIVHLIFLLIVSIVLFSCFLTIVGSIGGALFGIGYLLYLGTVAGYIFGTMGVMFVLFILFRVDTSWFGCGLCEYLTNGIIT